MWTKIYLAVVAVLTAVMAFFSYYSWSWLQSIGSASAAAEGYAYHAGMSRNLLWISTALLLMLGNAVFWVNDRLWAMWTTFTYFAVFTAIAYFWLEPASFAFNNQNGLSDAGFSARPFLGVGLILGMAAFVFVDQFVMIRMRAKTYPQPVEVTEKDEDNDRTA